jgi:hypothetical protein
MSAAASNARRLVAASSAITAESFCITGRLCPVRDGQEHRLSECSDRASDKFPRRGIGAMRTTLLMQDLLRAKCGML